MIIDDNTWKSDILRNFASEIIYMLGEHCLHFEIGDVQRPVLWQLRHMSRVQTKWHQFSTSACTASPLCPYGILLRPAKIPPHLTTMAIPSQGIQSDRWERRALRFGLCWLRSKNNRASLRCRLLQSEKVDVRQVQSVQSLAYLADTIASWWNWFQRSRTHLCLGCECHPSEAPASSSHNSILGRGI